MKFLSEDLGLPKDILYDILARGNARIQELYKKEREA
jgi:hypothetical protein